MRYDDLLDVWRDVSGQLKPSAGLGLTARAACRESTMETRIRRLDGDELCGPCFDNASPAARPSPRHHAELRQSSRRVAPGTVADNVHRAVVDLPESRMGPQMTSWRESSFLVRPDEVKDWRMVLLHDAAVDNGLLDALPGSAESLAGELRLEPHAIGVVLDGLALWDIVVVDHDGVYALGPAAPDADATAVLRHHARSIRGWSTINERIRGVAPDPAGMTPGGVEIMLDALAVTGRESAPGAVDACLALAPDVASVLDLGGGHGQYAAEFSRRGLRTVMQDRPDVIDLVGHKPWLADSDVELFEGDFFETVPNETFDLVFCAGVIHTMDGERAVRLLRHLRPLLAPGGLLALHTFLRGTDELATLFSAQMLGGVAGGQSHGEDDFQRWFDEAGYRLVATHPIQGRPHWILFASPASP